MDNLPLVLVYNILLRLPATTLGLVARDVCRSWHSIVADPTFIETHRRRSISEQEEGKTYLFTRSWSNFNDGLLITSSTKVIEHIVHKPPFPLDTNPWLYTTVLACNGLVLYIHNDGLKGITNFYLCNPVLRQGKTLQRVGTSDKTAYFSYGFGYDSITKAYKVVFSVRSLDRRHKSYFYCCTTNLETDKEPNYCWREVGSVVGTCLRNGIVRDGEIHWVNSLLDGGEDRNEKIRWVNSLFNGSETMTVTFHLHTESLKVIDSYPKEYHPRIVPRGSIITNDFKRNTRGSVVDFGDTHTGFHPYFVSPFVPSLLPLYGNK